MHSNNLKVNGEEGGREGDNEIVFDSAPGSRMLHRHLDGLGGRVRQLNFGQSIVVTITSDKKRDLNL